MNPHPHGCWSSLLTTEPQWELLLIFFFNLYFSTSFATGLTNLNSKEMGLLQILVIFNVSQHRHTHALLDLQRPYCHSEEKTCIVAQMFTLILCSETFMCKKICLQEFPSWLRVMNPTSIQENSGLIPGLTP